MSARRLIDVVRPDRIFHLAAQSFVPGSWNAPAMTMDVNVIGQINLFEAIRLAGVDPLVQIAGSSEEYGLVLPGRSADEGDQPAAAAVHLRGQQGGPGAAGLAVLPQLWPEDGHHPRVQPHRAAPGRDLRHQQLRQADRRDREGPARRRW